MALVRPVRSLVVVDALDGAAVSWASQGPSLRDRTRRSNQEARCNDERLMREVGLRGAVGANQSVQRSAMMLLIGHAISSIVSSPRPARTGSGSLIWPVSRTWSVVRVRRVHCRRVQPLHRRLASLQVAQDRPGCRRAGASHLVTPTRPR